jgi:hypothetical protein
MKGHPTLFKTSFAYSYLEAAVRHGLGGNHPGVAPGLEGPLQAVEDEEEHAGEHEHVAALLAHVPEEEEHEQHVQLVHAEEDFEPAASNVAQARRAHDDTDDRAEGPGEDGNVESAPLDVLQVRIDKKHISEMYIGHCEGRWGTAVWVKPQSLD